jgi:TnpA family transposase
MQRIFGRVVVATGDSVCGQPVPPSRMRLVMESRKSERSQFPNTALREIGRIERTLFTLEWLQSPDLRRRVQVGLNKGEAKNALARAVFFNRLGEIRDRTFENQR